MPYNLFRQALALVGLFPRVLKWEHTDARTETGTGFLYFSKRTLRERSLDDVREEILGALIEIVDCRYMEDFDYPLDYCFYIQISLNPLLREPIATREYAASLLDDLKWFLPARQVWQVMLDNQFNGDVTNHIEGFCNNCGASTVSPLDYFCDACEDLRALVSSAGGDVPLTLAEIDALPDYMPADLGGGSDLDRGVS